MYFSTNDLKVISIGEGFRLQPIDCGLILDDASQEILMKLGQSDRIKKYLPNLDFSSKDAIEKFIMGLSLKTETGLEFAYSIKVGNLILGMIFVNTPTLNEQMIGLEKWTVDFFILEPFEGKHYMKAALIRMMHFMKTSIHVDDFLMLVDQDNDKCLKLIESLPMDELDNRGFHNPEGNKFPPRVFHCPLSQLRFAE